MSGGIWRKCCKSDISNILSEITKGKRDLSFPPFFLMSPLIQDSVAIVLCKVNK